MSKIGGYGRVDLPVTPRVFGWGGVADLVVGIGSNITAPTLIQGVALITKTGTGNAHTAALQGEGRGHVSREATGHITLRVGLAGEVKVERVVYGEGSGPLNMPAPRLDAELARGPSISGFITATRMTGRGEGEISNGYIDGAGRINAQPLSASGEGGILVHGDGSIDFTLAVVQGKLKYGRHGNGNIATLALEGAGEAIIGSKRK